MPKTIEDLYRRGVEVTLDEGDGEAVVIWLQKLDPVQMDAALTRANAMQATVLASQFTEDDEWMSVWAETLQLQIEDVVEQLVIDFKARRTPVVAHRVAVSEPWAEEDYLIGLQTASTGMSDTDPASQRVTTELARFDAEIAEQLDVEVEYHRRELAATSTEELYKQRAIKTLKWKSLLKWSKTYNDWVLFYAVRQPDNHGTQLFDDPQRVFRLDNHVKTKLIDAYRELAVDPTEGKGSPGQPGSSASSEPAVLAVTNDSSGQMAA